jgi:hypothetical protein
VIVNLRLEESFRDKLREIRNENQEKSEKIEENLMKSCKLRDTLKN